MIKTVFNIASEAITKFPKYVVIDWDRVDRLGERIVEEGVTPFFNGEPKEDVHIVILKELIAGSINYCYWYGVHDIRPNNCSSTLMYDCVNKAVDEHGTTLYKTIPYLLDLLTINRFPLLEERKRHLYELMESRMAESLPYTIASKEVDPEIQFTTLVKSFQGYASDIFLKRASLFFIQLHRIFGWYDDTLMRTLHVPSDYQVPKILKCFGCMEYLPELTTKINRGSLIPKGSLEEIQIRAATILICNRLKERTGLNISDIDTYLWTKRKLTNEPFHCTITTDY